MITAEKLRNHGQAFIDAAQLIEDTQGIAQAAEARAEEYKRDLGYVRDRAERVEEDNCDIRAALHLSRDENRVLREYLGGLEDLLASLGWATQRPPGVGA